MATSLVTASIWLGKRSPVAVPCNRSAMPPRLWPYSYRERRSNGILWNTPNLNCMCLVQVKWNSSWQEATNCHRTNLHCRWEDAPFYNISKRATLPQTEVLSHEPIICYTEKAYMMAELFSERIQLIRLRHLGALPQSMFVVDLFSNHYSTLTQKHKF